MHLTANKFFVDFGVASRSKVRTLQDLMRRKMLKFIVVRLVSSILLRLPVGLGLGMESLPGFVTLSLPLVGKVARNATDEVERNESN